jgi:hypothetical protein
MSMKVRRYRWVRDGDVTFCNVEYDGVSAKAERAERYIQGCGCPKKAISVNPDKVLIAVNKVYGGQKQRQWETTKRP